MTKLRSIAEPRRFTVHSNKMFEDVLERNVQQLIYIKKEVRGKGKETACPFLRELESRTMAMSPRKHPKLPVYGCVSVSF